MAGCYQLNTFGFYAVIMHLTLGIVLKLFIFKKFNVRAKNFKKLYL